MDSPYVRGTDVANVIRLIPGAYCANGHLLTEATIYTRPNGKRCCRACNHATNRRNAGLPASEWRPRLLGIDSLAAIAERFWSKVAKGAPDTCWEWQASRNNHGYGQFGIASPDGPRRMVGAHRVAWELTNGPIPDGQEVCHRCDNPPCCNPADLFLGTQQDNLDDAASKGRTANQFTRRTHCSRGHAYTPTNTRVTKEGWRRCRDCAALRRR